MHFYLKLSVVGELISVCSQVTTFSEYCKRKYEVEPVEVIYADGKSYVCPDLSVYNMEVPLPYISGSIGVSLKPDEVTKFVVMVFLLCITKY